MWSVLTIIKPALIFMLCLYICLMFYLRLLCCICPDVIFWILPPCSRPMMSHHVTCHVTAVSHISSSSRIKKKRKTKLI